ncbi:glycoside hydrolase family 88 protein [Marinomonas sp. THO17]|uniref:beta-galactosidase BglB n=1 Tax=Marinomonas sp. THO17 TaxID=3149048 RepID=UPI00336BD0E4
MNDQQLTESLGLISKGFRSLKGIGEVQSAERDDILFDEWDWEVGVGLYGDLRDAERRKDQVALERIARWYDWQIDRGLPRRQVNSTAPMLALTLLSEHFDRPDWNEIIIDWADWLHSSMPKTDEGGFQHLVKERDNDGELWDDTLFMAALFMGAAGRVFSRQEWIEQAQYQYLCHIRFLGEVKSGLFYHGWTFNGRHNFAKALWARGNSWLTIAIPEIFYILKPEPVVARYLKAVFQTQLQALVGLQREDGMFHTLLDDPTSPVEASATAGFGYGVLAGYREGLIELEPYHEMLNGCLNAVAKRINSDGIVEEVSDGTAMGHSLQFYHEIGNTPAPYGQALASLFLSEYRALIDTLNK